MKKLSPSQWHQKLVDSYFYAPPPPLQKKTPEPLSAWGSVHMGASFSTVVITPSHGYLGCDEYRLRCVGVQGPTTKYRDSVAETRLLMQMRWH